MLIKDFKLCKETGSVTVVADTDYQLDMGSFSVDVINRDGCYLKNLVESWQRNFIGLPINDFLNVILMQENIVGSDKFPVRQYCPYTIDTEELAEYMELRDGSAKGFTVRILSFGISANDRLPISLVNFQTKEVIKNLIDSGSPLYVEADKERTAMEACDEARLKQCSDVDIDNVVFSLDNLRFVVEENDVVSMVGDIKEDSEYIKELSEKKTIVQLNMVGLQETIYTNSSFLGARALKLLTCMDVHPFPEDTDFKKLWFPTSVHKQFLTVLETEEVLGFTADDMHFGRTLGGSCVNLSRHPFKIERGDKLKVLMGKGNMNGRKLEELLEDIEDDVITKNKAISDTDDPTMKQAKENNERVIQLLRSARQIQNETLALFGHETKEVFIPEDKQ